MATAVTAPRLPANAGRHNAGNDTNKGTTVQRPSGCLKCGQVGHWARDCTGTAEQIKQMKEMHERGETGADPGAGANLQVPSMASSRRQRPKLTVDLLQESHGIPDIQENFYSSMRAVFRGKGHEISDARRLLELYKRWSDRVMPVTGRTETFDTFIAGVENFSTKAIVKDMLNMKRQDLLKRALNESMLDQAAEPDVNAGDAMGDDELLELAGIGDDDDAQGNAGVSGAIRSDEEEEGGANEKDDDELLELAGIGGVGPQDDREVAMGKDGPEVDDDDPEDLLLMEDEELLDMLFDDE